LYYTNILINHLMSPWSSIYTTVSCKHMAIPYVSHISTHWLEKRS